jgi:hypothetical protein
VTRLSKKNRERFFVAETSRRLGVAWNLGPDREHPDFVITEEEHKFGLEVSEIFMGPQGQLGSTAKAIELNAQSHINRLRQEYEAITAVCLRVQLVGN